EEDHPAREYFIRHFDIGREMLRAGFRAGVESGEVREDLDHELIIRQVLAMSEGLENQWLIDPEGVDIVACFHDYTRTLRDRLRRTHGRRTHSPLRRDLACPRRSTTSAPSAWSGLSGRVPAETMWRACCPDSRSPRPATAMSPAPGCSTRPSPAPAAPRRGPRWAGGTMPRPRPRVSSPALEAWPRSLRPGS